jgi:hypothetical protein
MKINVASTGNPPARGDAIFFCSIAQGKLGEVSLKVIITSDCTITGDS